MIEMCQEGYQGKLTFSANIAIKGSIKVRENSTQLYKHGRKSESK